MPAVNLSAFFPQNLPNNYYEDLKFEYFSVHNMVSPLGAREFCWSVPSGVTSVRMEIWGGGGGGAGACCCAGGQPGGSAAYAYKWIRVTPGTCYVANIAGGAASGHCCAQSNIGHCGERTFVTGSGLSNFCAEGGTPGITTCYCWWGSSSEAACCTYQICNWSTTPTYYGADGGSGGKNGLWQVSCCGNGTGNICGYKQLVPYPGGLLNRRGGYLVTGGEVADSGSVDTMCYNLLATYGHYNNVCANAFPGMGSLSAHVCGGSCCCGNRGFAGALRISYA